MKTEDLQALGLTEDQIKKVFELSGKDVNAEKKKTQAAEADRDQWKTRAETAEETLKGFDGVDVEGLNKQIEDWKNKAAEAEKDFQKQIEERDFADALKEEMEAFKFTSEAAKKAIMAEVKEAGLGRSERSRPQAEGWQDFGPVRPDWSDQREGCISICTRQRPR